MRFRRTIGTVALACFLLSIAAATGADDVPAFETDVSPILLDRCIECHNAKEKAGGLVLTNRESFLRGGDSGPAVTPGNAADSLLIERIKAGEMPPPRQGRSQKLPDDEIATLERWIGKGAAWTEGRVLDRDERTTKTRGGRDWWSLRPIVRKSPPRCQESSDNPIDAFILSRLEDEDLEPAPPADRRTLIRRAYFDVLGLPPSAEEIDAFVGDDSPTAHEKIVDRLLASPHYGERWARHWLDLVRYAETSGYERDQEKPGAWRYRDWVVRAFNADKPFDRFVLEQLAGDELPDRSEETVIGTGFLRLGTWNDEPNDPQEYKYERLEDLVHTTTSAFLGMTVKCARCHDHKFDPIPQEDYYRLAAAFWAGPIEPRGRELLGGPSKDELGFDVLGWTDLHREPPPLHLLKKGDPKHPLDVVPPSQLTLVPALFRPLAQAPAEAKTSGRRLQIANWIVDPANPLTARVFVNRLWQHHFGRGLVRSSNNFGFTGDKPTHPELLDWLAGEFVRGGWQVKPLHRLMLLSRTYRQASVHPREDEYAQRDFDNRFWWRAERRRLDAESLRDAMLAAAGRLDLRVGGPSFKPTIESDALEGLSRKAAAWSPSPPGEQLRRSLYIYSQRSLLPPMLTTFDFCDTTQPCGERDVSTVAPQALALLNNRFVHEQSSALALRVIGTLPADKGSGVVLKEGVSRGREPVGKTTPDPAALVRSAWRLTIGRSPAERELAACVQHLASQTTRFRSLQERKPASIPDEGLVLHLRADAGIERDADGRVVSWEDQSGREHHASQAAAGSRPQLIADGLAGRPAVRFDGQRRFLHVKGQVLTSQQFSVFAIVTDRGQPGHREIFSNWSGRDGNAGTSVFLGLTAESTVRFSDDFVTPASGLDRSRPFLLSVVASADDAAVFLNDRVLAKKGKPLSPRNLKTPWVIGQQGNIDGEYWTGDLAELLVYDRPLDEDARTRVSNLLADRFGLPNERKALDPERLALESLCHVLLNSNEFVYVD